MRELYIGMISGTSVDGVDCAIVEFSSGSVRLVAARTFPYPDDLRNRLETLIRTPRVTLRDLGRLDVACGRFFAESALATIADAGLDTGAIRAIGHHGQTVYHEPDGDESFTLQIGAAAIVATATGIETVADLRATDMALGGQGAPLVPAFHAACFADGSEARVIVNIGGIANITTLIPEQPVLGFDTGPGNTLMDLWTERCLGQDFDRDGAWAATGSFIPDLLDSMLQDPYFSRRPPKSTGRELFNADWLDNYLASRASDADAADVQATLAELTARTIATAVTELKLSAAKLIVCGGGAHNGFLLSRLAAVHAGEVTTTSGVGIDPDWVEAAAFAWLARARVRHEPGNVPTVTGARQEAVLGGLYSPKVF